MSSMLQFQQVACPYCGEWIDLAVDASAGAQQYVEDCQVCCRPMLVIVAVDAQDQAEVSVRAENEG
ncbi:CPXCG motif-containing cysteine-rich protein [Stenotrophomonas sp. MMGLT7]|uniref:CPXCG motif-containing cysteine-rich protein n=1 Tax=Stenotrophomonas sp. MMGLT7 TaxID=2901227 RepID=UPI001E423919|nr:CPXCG motif-containing cysteine-rich protein [Stenotrophomonas sp. MMGLT7]MCD7097747.1 CPXCG motif-containing cysteine-rich protein [Stenotrophomonas sp. MMGLT7]